MIFSNKLGVLPEPVFESLENDRMIAKGTVAEYLTEFLRVRKHCSFISHFAPANRCPPLQHAPSFGDS